MARASSRRPRPSLRAQLKTSLDGAQRLAILAVGSTLRGDDAAGVLVGERLRKLRWRAKPAVKVLIGETAPENLTGEIRAFRPSHLLVIDAIDASGGDSPCVMDLAQAQDSIASATFTTHNLPLTVMLGFLQKSLDCRVSILAIPAKNVQFGSPPSASTRAKARRIADAIHEALYIRANHTIVR